MAAAHNIRENIRYYNGRSKDTVLTFSAEKLSERITQMNQAADIDQLMLTEARMRQDYYGCFNAIIKNASFEFTQRTKRPPKDPLNALISFGNTILYNRIATEINKSGLDIRISFLHSTNRRTESLNLDIAEVFKPVIIDRIIFTLLNKKMLNPDIHFEASDNGGVYLNAEGKHIFLQAIDEKLQQKIRIGSEHKTYESIIRRDIKNLEISLVEGTAYKPYKYR